MTTLANAVLGATFVLALGLGLSAALRRQSAAIRHVIVASALAAAASVPVLQLFVPAWALTTPVQVAATAAPHEDPAPTIPAVASTTTGEPMPAAATDDSWFVAIGLVWLIGTVVAVSRLVAALMRLRRLGRRATQMPDGRWTAAAADIAAAAGVKRPIALLVSDSPELLATWGVRRPRIALPAHARDWDTDRVRAVLHHEIAHVGRGDWVVQLGAELIRAVCWWHPLVWQACRQLRRHSEGACDDAVLRAGVAPRKYAEHLLEIARSCRVRRLPVAAAVPMARPSTLQARVTAMLNPRLARTSPSARTTALVLLGLLGMAVPTAAIRLAQAGPSPLTGVVYDPTGAVMPEVALTLEDERQNSWTTTSDSTGRFEFAPVQAGRYRLEAKLPGFRPLAEDLVLQSAADWSRAVTLQVGTLRETITVREQRPKAPRKTAEIGPAPVRVGGSIRPPMKLHHVSPKYPDSMRDAGVQGTVPLEALIDRDGRVASVRVVTAQVHPDLAQAALEAVRQWRFSPTLLNGQAVEVVMTVSIAFELED